MFRLRQNQVSALINIRILVRPSSPLPALFTGDPAANQTLDKALVAVRQQLGHKASTYFWWGV